MSEPHFFQWPEQARLLAADSLCETIWNQNKDQLLQLAVYANYSLEQCQQLLIYKSLVLEWHMRPSMAANPERYFIDRLHEILTSEQLLRLHPSLRYNS